MKLPIWYFALVGVVANLFGQLGDLSTSLIKREAGIKDYSHIFLTHGGVLDRFDSILFIAPVVYAAVNVDGGRAVTKAISILGSTGSIGRQTLDVADDLGLRVAALSREPRRRPDGGAVPQNTGPAFAVLMEESAAKALKVRLADTTIQGWPPGWKVCSRRRRCPAPTPS